MTWKLKEQIKTKESDVQGRPMRPSLCNSVIGMDLIGVILGNSLGVNRSFFYDN